MAYENMVFALSPITSTIYMFHQPKKPGIMPDARRDVTNQFINGIMDRCKQTGDHVLKNEREMLLYSMSSHINYCYMCGRKLNGE